MGTYLEEATIALIDMGKALGILKERYAADVLLVEGDPALNHALVSTGLAGELFLTLAPKLIGGTLLSALTILEGSTLPHQKPKAGADPLSPLRRRTLP